MLPRNYEFIIFKLLIDPMDNCKNYCFCRENKLFYINDGNYTFMKNYSFFFNRIKYAIS